MNREEKRKFKRKCKKDGWTPEQTERLLDFEIKTRKKETIPEGTKVRLNYKNITSIERDYKTMQEGYRNIVEALKDRVCTVSYDKKYGDTPQIVCLEEDDTEPKWLFFVGDLVVAENEKEKGE